MSFRPPLTVLKGEIEVGLRFPRRPEEYQAILRSALEETDRIAWLVEGLLLLSRSDAGVLRMDRRPVNLKGLIEEVIHQVQPLAGLHSVSLRTGPVELAQIQGDPDHLRRLLLNLVDNGIKYTQPGGSVEISLRRDEKFAILQVSGDSAADWVCVAACGTCRTSCEAGTVGVDDMAGSAFIFLKNLDKPILPLFIP